MKKTNLPWLLPVILLLGGIFLFFKTTDRVQSAPASHVVISEVQIAGASASADFIELYNPTSSDINLSSFNLVKRTSSGSSDTSIVNFSSSDVIKSHGFLLWCFTDISSNLGCDKHSGDTITNNNSIAIRDGALNTGTIIDAVTIGVPLNSLGEGSIPSTPSAGESLERKANFSSDATSMAIGGADEFLGNGEDTDNNASDFVMRTISQPQNSQSAVESVPTPTLTEIPTPSPTPTIIPSPTPTETPIPSPTGIPSPTPIPTLEPSATPTPTIAPTVTPTPTPTPPFHFLKFNLVCSVKTFTMNFGFVKFQVPMIFCKLVRV